MAGRATIDDGVMIDLCLRRAFTSILWRARLAPGGVLWKEFNRETQLHGLAPPAASLARPVLPD